MCSKNDRAVTCVPKMIEHEQMFQNDRAVTGSKNDTNRNRCSKIIKKTKQEQMFQKVIEQVLQNDKNGNMCSI